MTRREIVEMWGDDLDVPAVFQVVVDHEKVTVHVTSGEAEIYPDGVVTVELTPQQVKQLNIGAE